MSHLQQQKDRNNQIYSEGSRQHVLSEDIATKYIVSWRIKESLKRLMAASNGLINRDSSVLCLCSGEGLEGSILCDLGFKDVTVSDLAENGVQAALERDSRLKGMVLNAENTGLENESFDIVLVQDGLHHLSSPVQGFIEMLRMAKKGVFFLEPHRSLAGRLIGRKWETNGPAVNYVFRWDKNLVEQVASSYLGRDKFENLSFSFWHHNMVYARIPKVLGSTLGLPAIKTIKVLFDGTMGKFGNQFCGMVLRK
jgi:ubiquinone/menaquinone biosynthesis C-methylase UbiE